MDVLCQNWEKIKEAVLQDALYAAKCLFQWWKQDDKRAKNLLQKLLMEIRGGKIIADFIHRQCYKERLLQVKKMGANQVDAEDIASEAILKTWIRITRKDLPPLETPCAYANTIARNLHLNRKNPMTTLSDAVKNDLKVDPFEIEEKVSSNFKRFTLSAINELNPINKDILQLHVVDKFQFKVVAERVNETYGIALNEGAARRRYFSIRHRINYSAALWLLFSEMKKDNKILNDFGKFKKSFKQGLNQMEEKAKEIIALKFKGYSTEKIAKKIKGLTEEIFIEKWYQEELNHLKKIIVQKENIAS